MQKHSIFVDRLFHKLSEHLLENCDLNVFLLNAHNWKLPMPQTGISLWCRS